MYKNYVVCYDPSPSVLLRLILSSGVFIGERSEPPSDKLGGEIFIFSCMLVCLSLYIYIYGVVRSDNQYHAHSHCCVRTPTLN